MERVHRVDVRRVQVGERIVDQIKVYICDMHLRCDLVSDRDIALAKRLADSHQAFFTYDAANAERVRAALGITDPADPVR